MEVFLFFYDDNSPNEISWSDGMFKVSFKSLNLLYPDI